MAYDKQTWQTGDTVTSAKLNHMEDGIASVGGDVLIVNATETDTATVLDRTWEEIHGASVAVIVLDSPMMGKVTQLVTLTGGAGGTYVVKALNAMSDEVFLDTFTASSPSDYPRLNYD